MLNFYFSDILLNRTIAKIPIREIIENTNFTTDIEPEVTNCLSSYGTFFDGVNFYYNNEILKKYQYTSKVQIIMNEILNFLSFYFISSRKMTQVTYNKYQNRNLIYLYHLGLVDKRVWYANSVRHNLIQKYKSQYGELDVILFGPNDNARQYLHDSLLTQDLGLYSPVKQIIESSEIKYVEIANKELTVTEYRGILYRVNYKLPTIFMIQNKNTNKKSKSLPEEFFSYFKSHKLTPDSTILSSLKIDENIISDNFQYFDIETLSTRKFSEEFIKKHKWQLNLPSILSNNKELSLQFIEEELLSIFHENNRAKNFEYEKLCMIIAQNYKLDPYFIAQYYCYNDNLVNYVIHKHKPHMTFWYNNFYKIKKWNYGSLIINQDLTYDFVIEYIDNLKSEFKELFKHLEKYQYKNFTQEQIDHIESIALMENLSL